MRLLHAAVIGTATLLSSTAAAQLSTGFAGGNRGDAGGAVYFDLTNTGTGQQINSFDVNYNDVVGTPVGLTVFIRGGTHASFEGSMDGWFQVAMDDGLAVAAGQNLQTPITLLAPFCIPAGATYGVALVHSSTGALAPGHEYTNGPLGPFMTPELTFTGGTASNVPFTIPTFTPRVANIQVNYTSAPGCSGPVFPAGLAGLAEPSVSAAPLDGSRDLKAFEDNWVLRWNAVDTSGTTSGNFVIVLANLAFGGSAPIGNTPLLPGFEQLWTGSTPAGVGVTVPPGIVGGAEVVLPVPPMTLSAGDTIRLQGVMIDPSIPGPIPALPTNTIEFVHRDPVNIEVRCDGSNTFNSNTAFGYFSINHLASSAFPPIESVTLDWFASSNPAQATMVFDTDQTGQADLFEGGNGGLAGCLGTYRNGSDATTGLIYDTANTIPATPCDPTANTGWLGANPTTAANWKTLDFRFTTFTPGTVFEFDCDTDGGAGIGGDDMAGLVVTINFVGGSSVSGEITAGGPDLGVLNF